MFSKELEDAFVEFKQMRKKKKKPLTDSAEKRQLNKINNLLKAGLNQSQAKEVILKAVDSYWDNIYHNEEHFDSIVNEYLKDFKHAKSSTKQTASNFFTFNKGTAYERTAEELLNATEGFDFITRIKQR